MSFLSKRSLFSLLFVLASSINLQASAQLVAIPGLFEGDHLRKVNAIYGELTSSPAGQAGKLIPSLLNSLSAVDQRALNQTYHQFRELLADPSVVEALIQELKTKNAELASNILVNSRNYGTGALDLNNSNLQELVPALNSPSHIVRKNVAQLLSTVSTANDLSAQTALIKVLINDPVPAVRVAAAQSLGNIGREVYFKNASPIAQAFAKAIIEDSSPQVRSAVASGLAQMGGKAEPAAAAICKALTDNSSQVRYQVLQAIIHLGPACAASVDELIDMYNGPKDSYMSNNKDRIIQALSAIGPEAKKAVPLIAEGLKERNTLANTARALAKFGPAAAPAVPELITALKSPYPHDRVEAAKALGAIGPAAKTALDALKAASSDDRSADGSTSYVSTARRAATEAIFLVTGESPSNSTGISFENWDR